MAYCVTCGTKLVDGAKFCQKCGQPVANNTQSNTSRRIEYAGKIFKCPNCGEVLHSFVRNCPSCGLELRATKSSSAVREFAQKLEAIEARREYEAPTGRFFSSAESLSRISKADEQKISLIQNFNIPNTKEDMLEFMILATSNVNLKAFDSFDPPKASEKALTDAWVSKAKQVYEKAKISYGNEQDFQQIQGLYDKLNVEIKRSKKAGSRKFALLIGGIFGGLPILGLIIFVIGLIFGPGAAKKESARLEAIEETAIIALENGEYKKALLNAEALIYSPSTRQSDTEEIARQWDVKRELLVDKILAEASANGVSLNRTEPEVTDPPKGDPFIEGFKEGIQPGLDAFNDALGNKNEDTLPESGQDSAEIAEPGEEPESSSIAETSREPEGVENTEPDTPLPVDSMLTIEKGSEYAFMFDKWNVYVATAVSDSLIQIDHWNKSSSSDKKVKYRSSVGTYRINDSETEFEWLDNSHIAFSFSLQDPERLNFWGKPKDPIPAIFTLDISNTDINKGSNFESRIRCYSAETDDWHNYRIIPLTETLYKVECWYRSTSRDKFIYGYDVGVINPYNDNSDFEWVDNGEESFILTFHDPQNSESKKPVLLLFSLIEDSYTYSDVQSYLKSTLKEE